MKPTGQPPVSSGNPALGHNPPDASPEEEYRRRLRKREDPVVAPEAPAVKQRKISKPPTAVHWHPVRLVDGQFLVDIQCLDSDDHFLDMDELCASEIPSRHEPRVETRSQGSVAGTGVFAGQDFQEGEIIGFYRGRLIKRTAIPEENIKRYCRLEGLDRYSMEVNLMTVWAEGAGGEIEFYANADSHVLWTGITVFDGEDTNIELGIDGMEGGNKLAYLNHIRPANVKPLPTLMKPVCVIGRDNLRHANGESFNVEDIWVPVVAIRDIKQNEELGFDYNRQLKRIDFPRAGREVFGLSHRYVDIDGHSVTFREHPRLSESDSSENSDTDSLSNERPLFQNTLSSEEEAFVEKLLERDPAALKSISEQISRNDESSERAVQLYLYTFGCQKQGTPLQKYSDLLKRCNYRLPNNKTGTSAVRDYVRTNFHKTEAARILNIAALDPSELQQVSSYRTRKETYELLDQVAEDTPEAVAALTAYLRSTFYRVNRKDTARTGKILGGVRSALCSKPRVLGKPGAFYTDEQIYKFMVREGIFEGSDAALYMPMPYLRSMLMSDNPEDREQGRKDLDALALRWYQDGKQPNALAALLQSNQIPNIFSEGEAWTLEWVMNIASLEQPDESQLPSRTETLVALWLNEKEGSSHIDMHQLFRRFGNDALKEVAYIMREKHGKSLGDISTRLTPFAIVTHDQLRTLLYERGVELGKTNRDLSIILERWAHVFYQKFRAAHSGASPLTAAELAQLDQSMSVREWGDLKKELKDRREQDDRNYMRCWTEMMTFCRTPAMEKIFLEDVIQHYNFKKLVEKLKQKKIPVFGSQAKEWSRDALMESAASHNIFNIRNSEQQHIAVLIAIAKPEGYMAGKVIDGKPFELLLEEELSTEGVYNFRMEADLNKKYPDNPFFLKKAALKRRSKKK